MVNNHHTVTRLLKMNDAKEHYKKLKADPTADPAAVKAAKKQYKALKKEASNTPPPPTVGSKRPRDDEVQKDQETATATATATDTVKALKSEWKRLKEQGANKNEIKQAKEQYKQAKDGRKRQRTTEPSSTPVVPATSAAATTPPTGPQFSTFAETPFPPQIITALTSANITTPTPIQAQAWPLVLTGGDLVAVAKTGSGKTLAFLLPAFHQLHNNPPTRNTRGIPSPNVLVVAPTRELAMQIGAAANQFSGGNIVTQVLYGGVPVHPMKMALQKDHPQCIVATCGRLIDLCERKCVALKQCTYVVLDEADRMLDMGFEPEMKKIFAQLPELSQRQTLLFSATWPKSIRKLAATFLKEDAQELFIGNAGNPNAELEANKAVSQLFIKATDDEKERKLFDLLVQFDEEKQNAKANNDTTHKDYRCVIFANTKNRVDRLTRVFWDWEFGTCAVHGGKRQDERDKALAKFIANECPVMFATDVAARGLDIKGVTHVINFDMARDVESYVHRIGRTGRAGELGASVTFWNPDYDKPCAPALVKIAKQAGQPVPPWLEKFEKVKTSKQWKTDKADKAVLALQTK